MKRRDALRSLACLCGATGLAGCANTGKTDDRCGDEPPTEENRNVSTVPTEAALSASGTRWNQPGYGPENTRHSPNASRVDAPAGLFWSRSVGSRTPVVPVVGDGRLYVSDDADRLVALDAATGETAWRSAEIRATGPVAIAGGVLFVGNEAGLHAVDSASRERRWTFVPPELEGQETTDGQPEGRPPGRVTTPLFTETTVYVGVEFVDEPHVYAIDRETGTKRWRQAGAVAAGTTDTVFVIDGGSVRALDAADGTTRWTVPMYESETVAVADGLLYGSPDTGRVAAYDVTSGEKQWEFEGEEEAVSPPSVSPDGVFVGTGTTEGSDGGNLYAFEADTGELRWCSYLGTEQVGSPAVAGGLVFAPTTTGFVQARDVTDGTLRWQFHDEYANFAHVTVAGAALFAGTTDGEVYAFGPETE